MCQCLRNNIEYSVYALQNTENNLTYMCIVSFWFKSRAFNLTLKVEREAGYSYSVQSLALTKLILVTKINAQNPPVHNNHLVVLQLVMQSVPTLIITIYQLDGVEEHPLKGHQLNFNTIIDIYVQLPSDEMGEGGVKIYVLQL